MATTIQIKRSSTASGVPLATDLAVGELAVNLADKRLFTKQSDGTIIELSTNPTDLDAATLRIDGVEITASATELNSLDGLTATTAELNILDGVTVTATELNTLDGITASTAELNKLDGYTGSTAELNILDGVTATTAELNKLDGFTGTVADLNYAKDLRATGVTTTEFDKLDGLTATTTELNYTDGVTSNIQTQLDSMVEKAGDTMTGDLSLGDNVKAKFGASDDLQIYHDGSHSYVRDSGTGHLKLQGTDIRIQSADGGENFLVADLDGAVRLYNDNTQKLQTTSTGVTVTGEVVSDGLSLGDNDKATFGASDDLQIYHDGGNSFITDEGTGSLYIRGSSQVRVETPTGENMAIFNDNGGVSLRYDNSKKFETTSTGVDVTGTVTADGLTVDNSGDAITITNGDGLTQLGKLKGDTTDGFVIEGKANNNLTLRTKANTAGEGIKFQNTSGNNMMFIDGTTGDLHLYENTGTTAKFVWDSSAESLGIGTIPTKVLTTGSVLEIESNLDGSELILGNSKGGTVGGEYLGGLIFKNSDGSGSSPHYSGIKAVASDTFGSANLEFYTGRENYENGTESVMKLLGGTDASDNVAVFNSNVGIGTASPSEALHVYHPTSNVNALIESGDANAYLAFKDNATTNSASVFLGASGDNMTFHAGGASERMRIDSSGNVGIGTASPSAKLEVAGTVNAYGNGSVAFQWGDTSSLGSLSFDGSANPVIRSASSKPLVFQTNGANERARIDSSGNLLVGTTSTNLHTSSTEQGARLYDGGIITSGPGTCAYFNRNAAGGDGTIIDLRKDGTTVGSIGTSSNRLTIGTGDTGLIFSSLDYIRPWDVGSNSSKDASVTLGGPSDRFKDLYLSGGVYLGGTGAANKLDDYEEGTWDIHIKDSHDGSTKVSAPTQGRYTKIGNIVHLIAEVYANGIPSTTFVGYPYITLPFNVGSRGGAAATTQYLQGMGAVTCGFAPDNQSQLRLATDSENPLANIATGANIGGTVRFYASVTYRASA